MDREKFIWFLIYVQSCTFYVLHAHLLIDLTSKTVKSLRYCSITDSVATNFFNSLWNIRWDYTKSSNSFTWGSISVFHSKCWFRPFFWWIISPLWFISPLQLRNFKIFQKIWIFQSIKIELRNRTGHTCCSTCCTGHTWCSKFRIINFDFYFIQNGCSKLS